MTTISFSLQNSLGKIRFFEEAFLLAETSIEVILGMLFLKFSNADIKFLAVELIWKTYTVTKALSTAKKEELIDKHEFAKAVLDKDFETFIIHVSTLEALRPAIQPS